MSKEVSFWPVKSTSGKRAEEGCARLRALSLACSDVVLDKSSSGETGSVLAFSAALRASYSSCFLSCLALARRFWNQFCSSVSLVAHVIGDIFINTFILGRSKPRVSASCPLVALEGFGFSWKTFSSFSTSSLDNRGFDSVLGSVNMCRSVK